MSLIHSSDSSSESSYKSGRFDNQVTRIKEQFDQFAPLLSANIQDMSTRITALTTSITTTENDWRSTRQVLASKVAALGSGFDSRQPQMLSQAPSGPKEALHKILERP